MWEKGCRGASLAVYAQRDRPLGKPQPLWTRCSVVPGLHGAWGGGMTSARLSGLLQSAWDPLKCKP